MELQEGTVVRDRRWGGRCTGTVVRREGDWVFVAWHGSCVEDQLSLEQVQVWLDPPAGLDGWRGGIGISLDGGMRVEPVGSR